MDLGDKLLQDHSRRQADTIAAWIGTDVERFGQLMAIFLKGDRVSAQRAAMVVGTCAAAHPGMLRPYLGAMVRRARQPEVHDAVKRCVVWVLQCADIPSGLLGSVANLCFDFLSSANSPVAIKAFSMTVLERIALKEPGLVEEVHLVIEQQLPYGSPGFKARARQVLASLDRQSRIKLATRR